jgi:hypothetical protein
MTRGLKRFLSTQWYWLPSAALLAIAGVGHLLFWRLWEWHTDWMSVILVFGAIIGFLLLRMVDKGYRR